jgi:hypothetical protein
LEKSFSLNADELAIPYNNENVNFKAFFDSENFKIENFQRIDENGGNVTVTVPPVTDTIKKCKFFFYVD